DPVVRARGLIKLKPKRSDEVGKALDEAIRSQPRSAELRFERGLFQASRGFASQADDDFIEAYALGNRDPRLIDRLIDTDALFCRVIARTRDDPEAALTLRIQRAERQARHQRWAGAAADYDVAVASCPEDPRLRRNQILTLLAAGEVDAVR